MKYQKMLFVVLISCLLGLIISSPMNNSTQAQDENPLKIEKVIGLSTIPGTFREPSSIAVAKDGTIFIADQNESQIEVYNANLQYLQSFGSIGSGNGQFFSISKIRFDSQDNLFVLDSVLNRMQVFTKEGKFIKKWGEKGEQPHQLFSPTDFAILPNHEIVIVDCQINDEVIDTLKVFSDNGQYIRVFFQDPNFSSSKNRYNNVETDKNGDVYINSQYNIPVKGIEKNDEAILRFTQQGVLKAYFIDKIYTGFGTVFGGEIYINGMYLYLKNLFFVHKYQIHDNPTEFLTYIDTLVAIGEKENDFTLRYPSAICGYKQYIYISDMELNRIVIFNDQKERIGRIQSPILENGYDYKKKTIQNEILSLPYGITVGPDKNIYVVSQGHNIVKVFNLEGKEINSFGKPYTNRMDDEQKSFPVDIIFDKNGFCYVSIWGTNFIGVFTKGLTPHTTIEMVSFNPREYPPQPKELALNSEGLLVVSTEEYPGDKLLFYDISHIAEKKYSLKKTITIPDIEGKDSWRYISDMFFDENDHLVASFYGYPILFWLDSKGKVIKTIDFKTEIYGILKDGEGNIYVTLSEIFSIYKLTPEGDIIWKSYLNWHRFQSLAMDSKGFLYVTDPSHALLLQISDTTAIPPKTNPQPIETEASFSFKIQNDMIVQDDNVTISIIVDELEYCQRIEMTIQYPAELLMYSSMKPGSLSDDADYQILDQSQSFGNISLLFQAKKGVFKKSGTLIDFKFNAIRSGKGTIAFSKIELKDPNGIEIHYKQKHDLAFIILPKDKTPPSLKISTIPKEVYDPSLKILGETESDATVTVNQQSVPVNPDGTFETEIILQKGENTISIIATDKAGNSTEFTHVVTLKDRIVIHLYIGQSIITINGKTTPIDSEPYIDKNSGRTMVPLRAIAESIGAEVTFDAKTQRIDITKETTHIQLWIGKPKAMVNGVSVDIDPDKPVSPVIIKGRTFLPLRFIAEQFEFKVDWDASIQRITLTYPKE